MLVTIQLASPAVAADPLFLWEVSSKTCTVSMTGSIHVGKPDFFPLPDPVEKAFFEADALAVEIDAEHPDNLGKIAGLMMARGMLPQGETLLDHLAPETWARLETLAEEWGTPLAMYQQFKPGILVMVLVLEAYQRAGFDPALGIDKHFLDQARERELEIRELETVEDQFQLFLDVSEKLDDVMVNEFLDQIDELDTMTEQMITYWRQGDVEGLDRLLQEQIGDDPEMVAFYRKLLDDRNVRMADTIDSWLSGDADVFVVVGAGHFSGEMGIVALLEAKGWNVKQVQR